MNQDTFLDTELLRPAEGAEIVFEQNLEDEDKPEIPTATNDELDNTVVALSEKADTERNKATMADVFRSGGIRAVSGIPQGMLSFLEFNGAVDRGSTADFTRQILAIENIGDMDLAQQLIRDTLANAVPIAAEVAATRGVKLKDALTRTSIVAPAGGYFSFVENPDQAAATSSTRLLNSGFGLLFSTGFMAASSTVGKGISALRGRGGEVEVGGPDIFPEQAQRQAGAETIEQAAERGVILSPGAATADPALVAQELKKGGNFSPETQRFLADIIGSNAKNTQALIDDLIDTIIPEGKGKISEVVSELYAQANDDIIPADIFIKFRNNPIVESIVSSTNKNAAEKAAYGSYKPNSIGKFNFIIKEIQRQIDSLEGSDAAAQLIKLKKEMQEAAKNSSEKFKMAVDASQREQTAKEVLDALTRTGSGELIPFTNSAMSFVNNFSNREVKEQMAFGIRSISDPKQQKEAFEKMNFILDFIPKVSQMEKTLQGYLKEDAGEFARRSGPLQAAVYTVSNFLNSQNSESFVRFILDPNRSAARLKEIMPKRITNTEDAFRVFGIIASEILEESTAAGYEIPFKLEEKTALNSSSMQSKAKTYEQLLRSGRLEEFMSKNPEAYTMLKQAYQQRAVA